MEPLILSINSATMGGSVCVVRGSQVLASYTGESHVSHSHTLLRDINKTLEEAEIKLAEIDLFATASGPGSFTGLRIGIATIKALSATLERPCVGIPSLEAVALAGGVCALTVALLPAGRGEVFAQMFSVSNQTLVKPLDAASHISPAKMLERYEDFDDVCWSGEGAYLYRDNINSAAVKKGLRLQEAGFGEPRNFLAGWRFAQRENNLAQHVATLALRKFEQDEINSPNTLSAIYVRPSDAELNQQCQPPN